MAGNESKYTVLLRNVDKTLGKVKRIDHINLETEPGKIYGLLGPNGAGKTTLFTSSQGSTGRTAGRYGLPSLIP